MKKNKLLFVIVLGLLFGGISFAQETVPKEVLLTTLNSVNELKLSNLKTDGLMKYNKGFVDKVYEILDSDKVEKDKVSALKVLNNDNERNLIDLFEKKGTYNKYVKLMKEELKPLIKKNKMLKYLF